jgi:hypothetical protein
VGKKSLKTKERQCHQASDNKGNGKSLHAPGDPAQSDALSDAGHKDNGKGKSQTGSCPVNQGFQKVVVFSDV